MSDIQTPRRVNGPAAESSSFYVHPAECVTTATVVPAPAVRTRKVAIVGFGRTAKDTPWSDSSWEVWAMNGWWRCAKPDFDVDVSEERYSLWFDMHTVEYTRAYGKVAGFGDQQEKWLEKPHPFPVFMLDEDPAFPSVRAYPIDGVVQTLGRDYFTSTIAYALAYAQTLPDVAEIGLWGIDLVHDTEYSDQRPCAEYWIARAEAAGIQISVPERSALLKQRQRYGYPPSDQLAQDMRTMLMGQVEGLEKVIKENKAKLEALRGQLHTDDGALQTCLGLLQRLSIYDRGGQV